MRINKNTHHVRCLFVKPLITFEGERLWPCGCVLAAAASGAAWSAAAGSGAAGLADALCPTDRPPLAEASVRLGVAGRCGDPPAFKR